LNQRSESLFASLRSVMMKARRNQRRVATGRRCKIPTFPAS